MSFVLINPGSGPVRSRTRVAWAEANLKTLLRDAGIQGAMFRREPKGDWEGRFSFNVRLGRRRCNVLMPGCARRRVRYLQDSKDNILDFPRLYIEGNSWIWFIGVDVIRDVLTGGPL